MCGSNRVMWALVFSVTLACVCIAVGAEGIGFQADPGGPGGGAPAAASAPLRGGKVEVMVELVDSPAAKSYAAALEANAKLGQAEAVNRAAAVSRLQVNRIEAAQRTLLGSLTGGAIRAAVLYRVQRVYNGIAVQVDADRLDAIRELPGVKAVHALPISYATNACALPLLNVPSAWVARAGNTGEGVTIGIIDSGVDYLHTDFGGPGGGYAANDPTQIGDVPNFPGLKIAGGYDFAGEDYDAGSDDPAKRIPQPDPDPMDFMGHGTHVAGSAAGYGVNADGSTFAGPYDQTTPFAALKIGPGVAPRATIYALKVFGTEGSTGLVPAAVEWATDPNGDGDLSDHLDVVNISLGGPYHSPDFPDFVAENNAALAGVIVVHSAGNEGDEYYVLGGDAIRNISVAASVDSTDVLDGFHVNSPAEIAGTYVASRSMDFDWTRMPGPVTGNLAYPASQSSGCTAFDAGNAALLNGKIALLDWNGSCGSKVRVDTAAAAGAIGVLIVYTSTNLDITIAGDTQIPAMLIPSDVGAMLKANLGAGVNVSLGTEYLGTTKAVDTTRNDTLTSFTSRGPRLDDTLLKPDVTAPGQTIFSALTQSGSQGTSYNGTSMAAPIVAGSAAILRQLHPGWTVEEIKALLMNTATHDLFTGASSTPPRYGPSRVGAGRVDLEKASQANAIAYSADVPGAVSVSFGVVEVAGTAVLDRTIKVVNKGGAPVTYSIAYDLVTDTRGVDFVFPGGLSLDVPANGSATFQVRLTADARQMKHSRDATVSDTQANRKRHWLSEEAGYVTLTPGTGPVLRVPVYAAARAASTMSASPSPISFAAATGTVNLSLSGQGIDQGSSPPDDEKSLVTLFELQDMLADSSSNRIKHGALQYVGVTSDYQGTIAAGGGLADCIVEFAIAAYGDWGSPNLLDTRVFIDSNRDGTDDYVVYQGWLKGTEGSRGLTDVFVTWPCPLPSGDCGGWRYINGADGAWYNTVLFNTNVLFLPVRAGDIGLTGSSRFYYVVQSSVQDPATGDLQVVKSRRLTYDPAHPGFSFYGTNRLPYYYYDKDGNTVAASYNQANFTSLGSSGILLLHHHNKAGSRAQAILVTGSTDLAVAMDARPDPADADTKLTYAVTVTNNGPFTATNVLLTDTLPTGVSFVSVSATQGTWTRSGNTVTAKLGTLAPGATATVTIIVKGTDGGSITNRATVSATQSDPNTANNSASKTTTITGIADLTLSKTHSADPIAAGQHLTYMLAVTNRGPSTAKAVTVTDVLPTGVSFVSVQAGQGTATHTGGVVTANLGSLPPGGSATVDIVVKPTTPGVITNVATVVAAEKDPDLTDNTVSLDTTVTAAPEVDLSGAWAKISKSCKGSGAKIKCTLKTTLTVKNTGKKAAPAANIRIYLSADAKYDTGDTLLKEGAIGQIAANKSVNYSIPLKLAQGVSPKGKYLICLLDFDDRIAETNEDNNTVVSKKLK